MDAGVSVSPETTIVHIVLNGEINEHSVALPIKEITKAGQEDDTVILLEINSEGGMLTEGFKLSKAIEDSASPVVCVVDGMAASEAFYILQSCDLRIMTKRSSLMAHEPSATLSGHVTIYDLERIVASLKISIETWVSHAGRRLAGGQEYLSAQVRNKDWWINPRTALQVQAVDIVVPNVKHVINELQIHSNSVSGHSFNSDSSD